MESDPRNGDIVVKLPTYISLALGSAVIRSILGNLPMDGTAVPVWDAIGLTPGTLGVDGCGCEDGNGSGGVKTSSVGEIFERIRQLQPPEEDEDDDGGDDGSDVGSDNDGSDVGSDNDGSDVGSDNDGSDVGSDNDGSDDGSDDGLGSVIEEDTT